MKKSLLISLQFLLLTIAFNWLLVSCCKDAIHPSDLVLPEVTAEGKNTFGCLINGDVFRNNGCKPGVPFGYQSNLKIIDLNRNEINFRAVNYYEKRNNEIKDEVLNFSLISEEEITPGVYHFSDSILYFRYEDFINSTHLEAHYELGFIDTVFGYLELTKIPQLSTTDSVLAGTFDFTIINDGNVFEFSQGRFDILYEQ